MGAAGDKEIGIRITVDAQGAVTSFKQLDEKLDDIKEGAEDADGGVTKFGFSLDSVSNVAKVAAAALAAVTAAAYAAVKAFERGDAFNDVANAFSDLSQRAGQDATEALEKLQIASQGTITNLQLMQLANKALIAGLDAKAFDAVVAAAKKYAEATGIEATDAINTFIRAITKGSDEQLKQLGIFKNGQIELERVTDSTLALATAQESTNDSIERAGATFSNLVDSFTSTIEKSSLLRAVTRTLIDVFEAVVSSVFKFGESLIRLADSIFEFVIKKIEEFRDGLSILGEVMNQVGNLELPSFGKAIDKISKQKLEGALKEHNWRVLQEQIKKNNPVILQTSDSLNKLNKAGDESNKKLKEQIEHFRELNGAQGLIDFKNKLDTIVAAQKDGTLTADQLAGAINSVVDEYKKLGLSGEEAQRLVLKSLEDLNEKTKGLGESFFENFFGTEADFKFATDELGNQLAAGLTTALSVFEDFKVSNTELAPLLSAVGGIVGSIFGPAGAAIGAGLGAAIGTQLQKKEDSLLPDFGGRILDALFGKGTGDKLAQFSVGSRIQDALLGESEGTKIRKEVDKFFSEIFNASRLTVIIDGQLQQIRDLSFGSGDFGNEDFFAAFSALPDNVQQSFRGVGLAFSEILGQTDELGSKLAAVFTNNLGGDLNNLQLLVKATGRSFEELSDAIIQAFLAGNVSAIEAQTALTGIQQIMADGIPGAVGATNEALGNLFEAGSRGGRAAIDALQDIAFEAQEAGLTSLEQAQQLAIQSGEFTAEQINAVFSTLSAFGIDSIEALATATESQIIAILANLQAQGILEDTTASIEDTAAAIEAIPANQEKRVTFIADVQYTDRASTPQGQAVLQSAGAPTRTREGFSDNV